MIRLQQVKVQIKHTENDLLKQAAKMLKIKTDDIDKYKIIKQSIDARHKNNVIYIYTIDLKIKNTSPKSESIILKKVNDNKIMLTDVKKYIFKVTGDKKIIKRPIIIGSGPAGLFCALYLSRNGFCPILIERGQDVDQRFKSVSDFWNGGKLNTSTNVQFGEGGAGTFSDGKLNTMVKDKLGRNHEVLKTFCEFGAPESILYLNKPHIGTDILINIVKNIRNEIISNGGEVYFETCLTKLIVKKSATGDSSICGIETTTPQGIVKHYDTENVILAIGHSARDTFYMLNNSSVLIKAKPFAVGIRIEHSQKMININQYGDKFAHILPPASYKYTSNLKNGRGVYTFCMCPGGYVVNASSESEMLAINGMSYNKRDSSNANSAVIVTVSPADFNSNDVLSGIEFQRKLEKAAYQAAKGKIPIQLFGDFKENRVSREYGDIIPCSKGENAFSNLRDIFPDYINQSLIEGITNFDKNLHDFARFDAILSGVESRTSSPIRILRDEYFESNIHGLYPCGEGAGYAGGITSAAMDGMKVAEAIAQKYHP